MSQFAAHVTKKHESFNTMAETGNQFVKSPRLKLHSKSGMGTISNFQVAPDLYLKGIGLEIEADKQ